MIKTFEQFSLCENESPKMKRIDFEGEYAKLINNLTSYIIEFIKLNGDIIFSEPQHLYYFSSKERHTILTSNFISIRVDGKGSKFGREFGNEEYGDQCLVGTTEDGQDVPIAYTTVPSNTYFIINDYIYSRI